ncbi:MAG TPA: aldo/keto reductase [Acidobacteriota bacterium]|nr:aldo/keto reductase [Acidobacteriota bacterium]
MQYRRFGRTGWQVSEIGYGMWGMGDWTGSDDEESLRSLDRAVQLGCNFFDTAWAYGDGRSERLLGDLLHRHRDQQLYVATKIPPKNLQWPAKGEHLLEDVFPADHIRRFVEASLANLRCGQIDLIQFHVWSDRWADDVRWQSAVDDLKREKLVRAIGISVNRWEPENCIRALRTGLIDSVQVIYNIFDQSPEDQLFPVCRDVDVAVIARVPFDEGTLTGTLTLNSKWPDGDWRNTYFGPENLKPSVDHAELLRPLIPAGMTMAEFALRFILSNPDVSTVIPGMRKIRNVEANLGASDRGALPQGLVGRLRTHRWDRTPAAWSD